MINIRTLGEHTSLPGEELNKLGKEYPILTEDQVLSLQKGDKVIVFWTGGNGPHEYTITRSGNKENKIFPELENGNILDFIGDDRPRTVVWKK